MAKGGGPGKSKALPEGTRKYIRSNDPNIVTAKNAIYVCPYNVDLFGVTEGLDVPQDCDKLPVPDRMAIRNHLAGVHGKAIGELEKMVGSLHSDDPEHKDL